jgi:hypothetical protein
MLLTSPVPRRPIGMSALCAAMVFMGLVADAQAQRVYKHVGPDGKVTFTDQPPTIQESAPMQSPTKPSGSMAEPAAGGPAVAQPAGSGSSKQAAKKALPKDKGQAEAAPAQASPAPEIDPALEKSVLVLMGYENIVAEFQDICLKTLPTSFKKYDGAAQKWKERHADLLARYPAVLRDFYTPSIQAGLRSGSQNLTRKNMANIYSAPAAARIKWCDDNADSINAGSVDMVGKEHYTRPLLAYNPRR